MKRLSLFLSLFLISQVIPASPVEAESRNPILEEKLNALEAAVVYGERLIKTLQSRAPLCPQDEELIPYITGYSSSWNNALLFELGELEKLHRYPTPAQRERMGKLSARALSLDKVELFMERADPRTTEYHKCQKNTWDGSIALQVYKLSCDNKDGQGCMRLAEMYANGQGVRQDIGQAAFFYRKTCENKLSKGCVNLGEMYEKGEGVTRDISQAVTFYRKACEMELSEGCVSLGDFYEEGQVVVRDISQALSFYQKGCDYSNRNAGEKPPGCWKRERLINEFNGVEVPNTSPGFDDYVQKIFLRVTSNPLNTSIHPDKEVTTVIEFRLNRENSSGLRQENRITDLKVVKDTNYHYPHTFEREIHSKLSWFFDRGDLQFPKDWIGGYIVFRMKLKSQDIQTRVERILPPQQACATGESATSSCSKPTVADERNLGVKQNSLDSPKRPTQDPMAALLEGIGLPDGPKVGETSPTEKPQKALAPTQDPGRSKMRPSLTEELNR